MTTVGTLVAGASAGILTNATGYLITGRLFHPYQGKTPNTWRASESWTHYQYAMAIRIAACIGIVLLYGGLGALVPNAGSGVILRGGTFALMLWAATILPCVLEVALFVNWHRGFVVGLLIDWLIVCVLASVAAAIAAESV